MFAWPTGGASEATTRRCHQVCVHSAEHAVEETLVLSGVEDTSGDGRGFWEDVREEIKIEFRVPEPAAF